MRASGFARSLDRPKNKTETMELKVPLRLVSSFFVL
jgi:hypothetical protein